MNITFGCSHTIGCEGNEPWTTLFERTYGVPYLNFGRLGGGFFHVLERARGFAAEADASEVRFVVLQKPEFVRFPWHTTAPNFFRDGGVLRARSDFSALPTLAQQTVAKNIFKAECAMLDEFVALFPNAQFAYWQQWLEKLLATHSPNPVASWLDAFERAAVERGFKSFGSVIEWEPLHERAAAYGAIRSDPWINYLVDEGWIISATNGHTTTKHNQLVADRVGSWMGLKELQREVREDVQRDEQL